MISRAQIAAWNTIAMVQRKLVTVSTCCGGSAKPVTSRTASITMKKLLVRSIARPNTAGQPLPVVLRAASLVPSRRNACSAMTITAPIAKPIRICSQCV